MLQKMKQYVYDNRAGILVSALAFFVSIAVFARVSDVMYRMGDTDSYVNAARNLLNGNGFSVDGQTPNFFRTPGYPLFLALIYALHGGDTAVIVLQYLLSAFCVFLTYRIGKLLRIQSKILWIVVLFLAVDINNFIYNGFVVSESLFRVFLTIALFFWVKYLKVGKDIRYFILFSFFLNYALFVRPILIYFNLLLLLAFVVLCFCRSIPWRHLVVYAAFLGMILGGWMLRNFSLTGKLEYSTVRNYNLLAYDSLYVYNYMNGIALDDAEYRGQMMERVYDVYPVEAFHELNPIEQADAYGEAGKAYLSEHRSEYIKVNLIGAATVLMGTCSWWLTQVIDSGAAVKVIQIIYALYLLASYGFYAYSLFVNRRKLDLLDFSIFVMSLYLLVAGMSLSYTRFRTAFFGLLLVGSLAAWREEKAPAKNYFRRLLWF